MQFTPRESLTILQALLMLQDELNEVPDLAEEIASLPRFAEHAPLSLEEISTLCNRLTNKQHENVVEEPRVIICCAGGLVTTVKSAIPLDVSICDFDALSDDDEEEKQRIRTLEAELPQLTVEAY